MGYYTVYSLGADHYDHKTGTRTDDVSGDLRDEINEELRKRDVIEYALTEDWSCYDAVKWYDHDDDMIEVSKMFPDVLFCLHGEGETSEDMWDAYYLNGKMQYCGAEIVYPPFDPEKLE